MKTLWVEDSSDLLSINSILHYFSSVFNDQDIEALKKLNQQNTHFLRVKKVLENQLSNSLYIVSDLSTAYTTYFHKNLKFDLIVLDIKFPAGQNTELLARLKEEVFKRYEGTDDITQDKDRYSKFLQQIFTDDSFGIILFDLICEDLKNNHSLNEIKQKICFFSGNDKDCGKFEESIRVINHQRLCGVRENMKIGKDLFFRKSNDQAFIDFIKAGTSQFSVVLTKFFSSGYLYHLTHNEQLQITDNDIKTIQGMSFYGFLTEESKEIFNQFFKCQIGKEDFKDQFKMEKLLDKNFFTYLDSEEYGSLRMSFTNQYLEIDFILNLLCLIKSNIEKYTGIKEINSDLLKISVLKDQKQIGFLFKYHDVAIDWDRLEHGRLMKEFKKFLKYGPVTITNHGIILDVKSGKKREAAEADENTQIELIINADYRE